MKSHYVFMVALGILIIIKGVFSMEKKIGNTSVPAKDKKFRTIQVLVVPVNFKDSKFQTTQQALQKRSFDVDFTDDLYSLTEYYLLNSDNQFRFVGTVLPKDAINLKKDRRHYYGGYNNNPRPARRAQKRLFLREVATEVSQYLAGPHDLKRADYDRDNNSYIDVIVYIYAGWTSFRPYVNHYTRMLGEAKSEGPTKIVVPSGPFKGLIYGTYVSVAEFGNIGDLFHEMGHILQFRDLYYGGGANQIMIMSVGNARKIPPPLFSFNRFRWVKPIVIDRNNTGTHIIGDYMDTNATNKVYKVLTDKPEQYWLIENRQGTHFDSTFYFKGLMIWHVDESYLNIYTSGQYSLNHTVTNNNVPEAFQLEYPSATVKHPTNYPPEAFWYSNDAGLAPTTTPSSQYAHTTSNSGVHIRNIRPVSNSKNMQFEVFYE